MGPRIPGRRIVTPDELPSDGLTIDTPRGPADLVLVYKTLQGEKVQLTTGERWECHRILAQHIINTPKRLHGMPPNTMLANYAQSRGVSYDTARRTLEKWRQRNGLSLEPQR